MTDVAPAPREARGTPWRTGAVLAALLAAALFGASSPASKPLVLRADPQLLAGWLYVGAALACLPGALRARSRSGRPDPTSVLRLSGAIVAGGVVAPVLLLVGLARAPASAVALWMPLETVATAALGALFFRDHLSRREIAGLVVVACAGALAAGPGPTAWGAAGFVALACICWGLDNNLVAQVDGLTPAQSTLAKGLVAGALNLGVALARGAAMPGAGVVVAAIVVGAACYGASIALYVASAQHLGATRSQALFATSPFFGAAVAWGVLHEAPTPWQLAGALALALGLVVLLGARHEHLHEHGALRHVHWHRHDDGHHHHDHDHDHAHGDDAAGIAASTWHLHAHDHAAMSHSHPHVPDLHHRHEHGARNEGRDEAGSQG